MPSQYSTGTVGLRLPSTTSKGKLSEPELNTRTGDVDNTGTGRSIMMSSAVHHSIPVLVCIVTKNFLERKEVMHYLRIK